MAVKIINSPKIKNLGVYNQAIQDARAALQSKLDDLEGEFYEPEPE